MKKTKWFDRKFDFSFQENIFPSIIERLDGTFLRIKAVIDQTPPDSLEIKPDNKWSVKEHIGHLTDLEPLWRGRLDDIFNHEEFLRHTDLENKKTDLAEHNKTHIDDLLAQFE